MIEQTAVLMRTSGDRAWVRLGGQSGCPLCDAGQGCGGGLFGRLLRRRPVEVEVGNRIQAAAGQAVLLGLPESAFLSLVFSVYGWPLLAGLAGALLSHQMGGARLAQGALLDAVTLAGALTAAALVWRAQSRRRSRHLAFSPVQLIAVVPGPQACTGTAPDGTEIRSI